MLVSGQVLDNDMIAIPGAEVSVIGTTYNDVADEDGNFAVTVPTLEAMLHISAFGYNGKTIKAKDFNSYIELSEAVVVQNNYKKPTSDNTLLYVGLAVVGAFAISRMSNPGPQPRKVKV